MSIIPSITLTPALSGSFGRPQASLISRVWTTLSRLGLRGVHARRTAQHRQAVAHDSQELFALAQKYERCSPSLAADLRAAAVRALQD